MQAAAVSGRILIPPPSQANDSLSPRPRSGERVRKRGRQTTSKPQKRTPPHEPVPRCTGNGLLSPALSSRGGEGEGSSISKVRGFKARILSGSSLPEGRGRGGGKVMVLLRPAGLETCATSRMNSARKHNLVESNGNQEWRWPSHAGDEVYTFDCQVRNEVGPGGHEQPDVTAGPFAHGVLSIPYDL